MIWLNRVVALVIVGLLHGCLADDRGAEKGSSSTTQKSIASKNHLPGAPKAIDPRILADRAFGEAPILAERVSKGRLPPVAERLPDHPLVVVPIDEIGRYGGTLRRALTGDIAQTPGVIKTLVENLMDYERPGSTRIEPNLAERHTFEDEGRTAIFKIRTGLKWSDGVPFTVDDILFWYHDMALNDDARSSALFPSNILVEGKPIEMSKVDAHTLKVTSHRPLGRILDLVSNYWIAYPKHILSSLHPVYNPEATYEGFRDSTTAAKLILKPGLPRMSPWIPVEWVRGQRVVYERNPYYFKIDSAGNQLPYADRLVFNIIPDPQVILLKFMNGEIDLFGRYAQVNMYATLKTAEQDGKFRLMSAAPVAASVFYVNWDAPNVPLRDAFRDRRVRQALSHAINREELSAIVYHGLLDPGGFTFGPFSAYHDAALAYIYVSFDLDRARSLLDEAGLVDRDGDGLRELGDGSVFAITIDVIPGLGVDVCELVAEQWRAIGIKVTLNIALRDILFPKRAAGDFEVFWWWSMPSDPSINRHQWAITGPNRPFWHRNAAQDGPEWLLRLSRWIEEVGATVDPAVARSRMIGIRDLITEEVPIINSGFVHPVGGASTRLGNVPDRITTEDAYMGWSRPVFHEQLFIKDRP
jgi:peptide/nickel transport system substrate-binding protein